MNGTKIFDAARNGDISSTRDSLEAGADPAAMNEYGFTALHCAAMGANSADQHDIISVMRLLVEAGSPMESVGGGGRTPLYLAAEFSLSLGPVQYLIDAGANPNVTNQHGNHIVKNAMMPEVKELLSRITGVAIPPPPPPPRKAKKLASIQWRNLKPQIDTVFETLSKNGLVALQDSGYTQEDAFADCSQAFHDLQDEKVGVHGFCFYTRQDLNRAKRTSQLALGFWGAPEGAAEDMARVGDLIVQTFRDSGFTVDWDGSGGMRPVVILQNES